MAIKRLSTRLLAAALIGAFVLPTVTATSADAKDRRHGWHKRHDNWHGDRRNRHHRHHKRDRGGDAAAAIALGVIGLAAGAAIASAANQPDYIDPPYDPDYGYGYGPARGSYIDPADRGTGFRKPYYPEAPTVVSGSLEPWTAEWYAYCADKYRSFDPRSGTYTAYSGAKRFCR
jgi:Ni/Co efflux regulator RcnB